MSKQKQTKTPPPTKKKLNEAETRSINDYGMVVKLFPIEEKSRTYHFKNNKSVTIKNCRWFGANTIGSGNHLLFDEKDIFYSIPSTWTNLNITNVDPTI